MGFLKFSCIITYVIIWIFRASHCGLKTLHKQPFARTCRIDLPVHPVQGHEGIMPRSSESGIETLNPKAPLTKRHAALRAVSHPPPTGGWP